MSQPTGEHASGVKLASAYVEVNAHTKDGMRSVHDELTGVEQHAQQVGQNSAASIVTAISAAGEPAARGFTDRLHQFATTGSKTAAEQSAMGFRDTFVDSMKKTRLVQDADWLFDGFAAKSSLYGADAANSFHGRFIQLMAANRIDAANEAEKTGAAVGEAAKGGLKKSLEGAAEGLGMGEMFNKASEGVGALGSKFGEAGEQAGSLGEKMGGLAAPLAMFADPEVLGIGGILAVVGAAGLLVDKMNELGESFEQSRNKLRVMTGATGEQLAGMQEQVKGVYGATTLGLGDVTSIVGMVNTAFKDTGAGAQQMGTVISQLEARSGAIDLNSLGRGFRAFNITGDAQQQVNVLEQLEAASQKTQIPINTLIESFTRAAPIANQFHLSIGETVAVMSQFDQAGLAPQNTMFMLSKAAAEATKNHQDFATVLQTTIDKIRNAQTEQEKLDIAGGLVGKTSGRGGAAQLVQAVNEGLSLDPATLAQLQNAHNVIEDNFNATMTWGDQWTLFKHKMEDALEPTGTELHEKVANVMEGLVNFLGEHQTGIAQFVGTIVDGFEKGATSIGHLVQEALPSIKSAIDYMRPAFQEMEPSLIRLGQAMGPLAEAIGRDVVPIVKALGEALIWSLTESMKHLPPVLDAFHSIVDALTDVFNYLHDHTVPAFHDLEDAGDKLKPVFHDLGVVLHDTFNPIVDVIKEINTGIDKLYDGTRKVIDDLSKIHLPGISHSSAPGLDTSSLIAPPAHGQTGLALSGYGGGDIVPAMLEPGEHVVTKEEVSAVGGQDNMYIVRALMRHGILQQVLGFDGGGDVSGPQLVTNPQPGQQYHVAVPGQTYRAPSLSDLLAPQDTGGLPSSTPMPPGILVGSVKPEEKSKLEAGGKGYDILSQGHTGADLASKGARGAEGLESLGQVGSWAGTAAEAVEPYSKLLGGFALPWDVLGAANWGLNVTRGTNLSPTERLQQWWANFSASPKDHASADKWNAEKGSTPQNIHIPGTNTNLLDIFKSVTGYGGHSMFNGFRSGGAIQRFATGGSVHPAGREKRDHSWVLDRYKMAKPLPLHFQDGGGVGGYGGLTDVKALLSAESGRTPYVFGGYSPTGIDCSGLVAEAVEVYLGLPMSGGHPMATGSEAGWLASHGFQQGYGPEGSFRVGFYNGGEGGGHTALTLPDGTNAESGGSGGGVRLGGGAAGANNAEFTDHWYLPPRSVVSPAGWSGGGGGGSGGYGGAGGSGGGGGGGFGGTSTGGGAGGGATPAQLDAMNSKVTATQGRLDVANQRLQEAQDKPIKGDGYDAQAKAQATKDADIKRLTEERDRIQGDLDSQQAEAAGLSGSSDPKNLIAAKDRITEANQRLGDAQKKLDDDRADPKKKPSEITADENAVAAAKERVAKAEEHLQNLQDAPAKKGRGGREGGGKGDGTDWGGLFGDTAMKAFGDNMIPGFSNPMDWGVTKSASALFKFFGSLLGGDGKGAADSLIGGGGEGGSYASMVGGGAGGPVSPYVQGLMSKVPGYTASSNPDGKGDINVTHQANYYGDINDGQQHAQAKLAADKRTTNKTINPYRLVTT